jgi:hypothetical protein
MLGQTSWKGTGVTGGNARHGRRNNGLYAAEYAVVGDVDPRVGEHLLDVLGNRGIAAYLQPAADQHPITRLTTLPSRPTDRLYVDRAELTTARQFLDMVGGEAGQASAATAADDTPQPPAARTSDEFEDAWASIVAAYHETAETTWPTGEDVGATPPASSPTREWPRWSGMRQGDTAEPPSLRDGLDQSGRDLPDDDDEEDYQPPPPPPLPRLAAMTVFAVLAIGIGFTLIIFPDLLPIADGAGPVIGGALLIAGAVALIARLRSGNDDDPDDPDLGAVV